MTAHPPVPAPDPSAGFSVACARPWLVARFARPQRMVSWSVNRPGFATADAVAWLEVGDADFSADMAPQDWFRARLSSAGLGAAVGLMTARNVERHHLATHRAEGVTATALVTLGLNNGERVGRRYGDARHALNAGTINILCHLSRPLGPAGLLEAAALVTQARTVALLEAGYRRFPGDDPVTGTGTDCVVMAAPDAEPGDDHAGMHTANGEAVGAAVLAACRAAWLAWQADQRG